MWPLFVFSDSVCSFSDSQMFDNIAKLRFVQGHNGEPAANAMISAEGEMMEFRTPVVAEGKVEDWMTEVLGEMRRTNRLITKESVFRYLDGMSRSVNHWHEVCNGIC